MILNPLEQKIFVLLIFLSLGAGIIVPVLFDLSYWTIFIIGISIILTCFVIMMGLLLFDLINSITRKRKLKRG